MDIRGSRDQSLGTEFPIRNILAPRLKATSNLLKRGLILGGTNRESIRQGTRKDAVALDGLALGIVPVTTFQPVGLSVDAPRIEATEFPRSNHDHAIAISAHASCQQLLNGACNARPSAVHAFPGIPKYLSKDCMCKYDDVKILACRLELGAKPPSTSRFFKQRFPDAQARIGQSWLVVAQ